MLGKLGAFLNRDVSSLVKDAGKILTADVGTLAKGAGKVLNADPGAMLRDKEADTNNTTVQTSSSPVCVALPATAVTRTTTAVPTPPMGPSPPASRGFDPDATVKLVRADGVTLVLATNRTAISTKPPLLDTGLVSRHQRTMPVGTSLRQLLPHAIGEFERSHSTPAGELASDPVSAMYSASGHPIALQLVQCWDDDEARDRLDEVKLQAGKNFRIGDDKSWILGTTLQGLVFAWNRGNYSFTAIAPKGEISMVRFLKAFPY